MSFYSPTPTNLLPNTILDSTPVATMSLSPSEPPLIIPNLPPPFINIPSLPNLRDAGGYPSTHTNGASTPSAVRRKLLYRSADPSRISRSDLAKLHQEHGITTIFDLRSWPEIERAGTLEAWEENLRSNGNVTRHWRPVFKTEDYSPEKVALRFMDYGSPDGVDGFVRAYTSILENAGPSVGAVMRHLASPAVGEGEGILVHCSGGKDRAGCVVAVVLSVVGVPEDVVAEEYALTQVGMGALRSYFVDRIVAGGTFGDVGESEARSRAERMVTARKEAMVATLEVLRRRWSGAEEYVRSVAGVDGDVIEAVRRNLLGGGPAVLVGDEDRAVL